MHEITPAHPVALILGSGFKRLAGLVKPVQRVSYEQIVGNTHAPEALAGLEATVGTVDGKAAIVYPARLHLHKGFTAFEVSSLVRHAHAKGCRIAIFVGACGAVAGEEGLGVVSDHINLTGTTPLTGWQREGDSFVPMNDVYDTRLRKIAREVAKNNGMDLPEGVYAEVCGPNLETPAEVRALGLLGANYVGMSLSLEAIMAHALGMKVLAFSLATNQAGASYVSHRYVRAEATSAAKDLETVVRGVLARL